MQLLSDPTIPLPVIFVYVHLGTESNIGDYQIYEGAISIIAEN